MVVLWIGWHELLVEKVVVECDLVVDPMCTC